MGYGFVPLKFMAVATLLLQDAASFGLSNKSRPAEPAAFVQQFNAVEPNNGGGTSLFLRA